MDTNNLIVWLPFDASTTTDHCGGQWTAFGDPVIRDGKIYLDGNSSYVAKDSPIELGGNDFTICGKFKMNSGASAWCRIFTIFNTSERSGVAINLTRNNNYNSLSFGCCAPATTFNFNIGNEHHFEIDYVHADGCAKCFLDGELKATVETQIERTTFANCWLGRSTYSGDGYYSGTIDEFMIFDGVALHTENFTPPTDDDYFNLKLAEFGSVATAATADFELITRNKPNIEDDACYKFTGAKNSYATLPLDVLPGATEFTIEVKFSTTTTASYSNNYQWKTIVGREIQSYWQNDFALCVDDGKLCFWAEPKSGGSTPANNTVTDKIVNDGQIHTAAVRANPDGSIDLFCDGEHIAHTDGVNAKITDAYSIGIAHNINNNDSRLAMDFYEARLWSVARDEIFSDIDGDEDGLEAWYLPTPTGIIDYSTHARHATISGATYTLHAAATADCERILTNNALAWRYEDRIVYIGTGNPITFHVPRSAELWAKFKVYFDGLNRWYASDDNANGLAAQPSLALDFTANNSAAASFAAICTPLTNQSFLLHMKAGTGDGLIEAWAGTRKVGEFVGNVNNGKPFENFNLRSDDTGTSFTDLIISNQTLLTDETPNTQTRTYHLTVINLKAQAFEFTASTPVTRHYVNVAEKIHSVTTIFKPINSLWLKFTVTSDGVHRWAAYNLGDAGQCGISALSDADFIANSASVTTAADVCNGKQTFILHMLSDADNGLIELFCDGQLVASYTGNVNDGNEFTDVYLTSEGDDAVFENFMLSTEELTFDSAAVDVQSETALPSLTLNIFHNGQVISYPLTTEPSAPALTIRKLGSDWFAPLSVNNSPLKIFLGGQELSP